MTLYIELNGRMIYETDGIARSILWYKSIREGCPKDRYVFAP